MAGTPGWCCLVSFTWAHKCQAQTPHGSWEVGEQWPPCPTLAGHLRRGLGFPSGLQRLWAPRPADSPPGRLAQSRGFQDKAGHGERGAGCWTCPPRTASSRSSSAASGRAGRSWALGEATTQGWKLVSFPLLPPSVCGPDEASSANSAHPARSQDKYLHGGRNSPYARLLGGKLFRQRERERCTWSKSCHSPRGLCVLSFLSCQNPTCL